MNARYSMEAEFHVMAQDICEASWIKGILVDLCISYAGPIKLFCDNKYAIEVARNLIRHDRI